MAYFHVSNGLRGCYMPDSAYVLKVDSRRELKAAIRDQAGDMIGANKRAVAHVAAIAWRNRRKSTLPCCLPLKSEWQDSYSYGVFVSGASRAEYLDYCKAEGVQP